MAFQNSGGASRQKIDLNLVIKNMLDELAKIEQSKSNQSTKTKKFKRLARTVKTQLHNDGRKDDDKKITLSTYKRYLVKVRKAIKKAGYKHHSLKNQIARKDTLARLLKDYPQYNDLFAALANEPALTVTKTRNDILKKLMDDKKSKVKGAANAYNDLKKLKLNHEIITHLILDDVQSNEAESNENAALNEKMNSPVVITYSEIQNIIKENIQSKYYTRQAVALALACGRREIEIIYNASFEYVNEQTVLFKGQAKKQEGIKWDAYEIPVLIPANDFINAFNQFRNNKNVKAIHEDFKNLDKDERNDAINKRVSKTLNGVIKKLFADRERTFKDCRAIYTNICVEKFWDKKEKTIDLFVKSLLGHAETDYKSAWHYKHFAIDFEGAAKSMPEKTTPTDTKKATPTTKTTTDKEENAIESKEVQKLTQSIDRFITQNPKRKSIKRYHDKVLTWIAANPDRPITKTAIYHKERGGVGGSRDTIKTYLDILASSGGLDKYNKKRA